MFHLAAYTELIDNVANNDVTALTDDVLAITNGHFLLPEDLTVSAAYAAALTLARVRINSPTIRGINPAYIRPFNLAVLPATDPNVMTIQPGYLRGRGQEELAIEASAAPAMTERFTALLWLMRNYEPVPIGEEYNCRLTSTTTAVVNSWTTIAYTQESNLPVGTYAVIGGDCQSTNGLAFRMIFDKQELRPGWMSITALGNRSHAMNYDGRLGVAGRFRTFSLPRIQVLANVADAAHEIYLRVVRIAS